MEEEKPTFTRRFKLGIALIVGSILCGWLALAALGGGVGAKNPALGKIGLVTWFLTWIPFFAGLALSGKEGLVHAKRFIRERILRRPSQ